MSSAIFANKKIIMQISILKSQKTSSSLGNLYVGDWEKGGKIRASALHLISRYFQGSNWDLAGLKKWGQRNKLSFYLPTRPQDLKNQRWNAEN